MITLSFSKATTKWVQVKEERVNIKSYRKVSESSTLVTQQPHNPSPSFHFVPNFMYLDSSHSVLHTEDSFPFEIHWALGDEEIA